MDAEAELRRIVAEHPDAPEPERTAALYAALGLLVDGYGHNALAAGLETLLRQYERSPKRIAHPFAYAKAALEIRAIDYNERTSEDAHEARTKEYRDERRAPQMSSTQRLAMLLERGVSYDSAVRQVDETEAESYNPSSEVPFSDSFDEELTEDETP